LSKPTRGPRSSLSGHLPCSTLTSAHGQPARRLAGGIRSRSPNRWARVPLASRRDEGAGELSRSSSPSCSFRPAGLFGPQNAAEQTPKPRESFAVLFAVGVIVSRSPWMLSSYEPSTVLIFIFFYADLVRLDLTNRRRLSWQLLRGAPRPSGVRLLPGGRALSDATPASAVDREVDRRKCWRRRWSGSHRLPCLPLRACRASTLRSLLTVALRRDLRVVALNATPSAARSPLHHVPRRHPAAVPVPGQPVVYTTGRPRASFSGHRSSCGPSTHRLGRISHAIRRRGAAC